MKVRQIENQEIDQIGPLWNELKRHHQAKTVDFAEHYLATDFKKRKAQLWARDQLAIFIAEDKGRNHGFCVVSISDFQGYVDSLYVRPENRKTGSGKALMDAGLDWLTQHGPENISVSIGQGNEEVLPFYERFGFKNRATVMEYFG